MAILGRLGTVLGAFLVPLGAVLGRSWRLLGRSGAVLRGSGASWKDLGGSRGVLYEILEHVRKTYGFCKDSLSQRRSKDILERLSFGISSAAERSEAALDDMLEADPTM